MSDRGLHEGLPRRERLRKRTGYLAVQGRGQRVSGRALVVYALSKLAGQPECMSRLGITVNKKVGKAVVRNRVKRWLRESYRRMPDAKTRGADFVIIAKPNAATSSYQAIREELRRLLHGAGKP